MSCADHLSSHFAAKWGTDDMHLHSLLKDIYSDTEALHLNFTHEDLSSGFRALHKKFKCDWQGVCVRSLEFLWMAQPAVFLSWFNQALSSSTTFKECSLNAAPFGKGIACFGSFESALHYTTYCFHAIGGCLHC